MNGPKRLIGGLAALSIVTAMPALAADAANGKRLAQEQCAACHIVAPYGRNEVADSPPFETIGLKFGFDHELLVASILAPHPRMNLTLNRNQADDIAAYIQSLAKQF